MCVVEMKTEVFVFEGNCIGKLADPVVYFTL